MAIALNLLRANKDHKFITTDNEMVAIDEIFERELELTVIIEDKF